MKLTTRAQRRHMKLNIGIITYQTRNLGSQRITVKLDKSLTTPVPPPFAKSPSAGALDALN